MDNGISTKYSNSKSDITGQGEVVDDFSDDDEDSPLYKDKTYKDICCTFAENNSFHGIPYISKAENWYSRIFWTLAFLFFMVAWTYHSYFLIAVYLKYESTNTLNYNYESLEFPSVTLCNVNPIKLSELAEHGSPELIEYLVSLRPNQFYSASIPEENSGPGSPGRRRKKRDEPTREELRPVSDSSFGTGETSSTFENYQTFKRLYTAESSETRFLMGHQKDVFILTCSFNGLECSTDDFELYESSDYGNCYTFNGHKNRSNPLKSARSGSAYGLDLTLFIENDEYLNGMPYGTGVRYYVHPVKTLPNVYENGISAPPGMQSLTGFTMYTMKKLDGNFGNCDDDGSFTRYHGLKYTQTACTRTCLDRTIARNCRCVRMDHFENYNEDDLERLPSCYDDEDTSICANNLEILSDRNKVECGCDTPCRSTDYEYLTTESIWPDSSYWFTLVDYVCEVDDYHCQSLRAGGPDMLSSNFLNLKIYYRDLNYKEYIQQSLYEDAQFISDMGGCIGLWVGASAITVIEMIDFIFKCCNFAIWRNQQKTKYKEKLRAKRFREEAKL